MLRIIALALMLLGLPAQGARAQPVFVVTTCGTVPASLTTLVASTPGMTFVDTTGKLCVNAAVSASITGFPTSQSTGTPISVTSSAGGVAGTLPTGAVVVATNVGTTNGAYCKLGASATTSDQFIAPNGGWFAFTVGASTQLTCITSTSTTTVNMVGGSGLPTGTGGGGGAAGSAITTWAGGTLGAMANYGTSPGAVLVPGVNASVTASALPTGASTEATLASVLSAVQGAIPAGTALIGKVGVDQTTPGTTNGVAIVGVNAATALAGNGATGTGSQRITLANDNTIPTGWPTAAGQSASQPRVPTAGATGGATVSSAIAPATPAGVNLKASAGTLYGIQVTTIQATPVYVKFYNSASAPTCGSGTPVARFMVPAASTAANGAGTNIMLPVGVAFGTGLGYCVTGALADNDTTAITANNTLVNIEWN